MKKFAKSYGIYLLATVMICVFAFYKHSNKLSAKEFSQKMEITPTAQLLDVRTATEFSSGYIKGAINIDWQNNDFNKKVAKLDKATPVFVYCHTGHRSSSAAKQMRTMGFGQVYELNGGIEEWQTSGLPVLTKPLPASYSLSQ